MLSARGAVELWSGHLDEAVRVLDSGVAAAATSGCEPERAACLGHLALAEALRGQLRRAAMLAEQATAACTGDGQRPPAQHANPAALVALAWVHLEHHELKQTRSRLTQLNAVLAAGPDKLIEAIASLVAAYSALAEGRDDMAAQAVARARSGWQVPAWLERKLSLVESRASVAAGKIRAALADAERAGRDSSPEATVILAHARMAAGDGDNARRTLEPLLAARNRVPERVRLQACLVDARLSYDSGDRARGRRSLGRRCGWPNASNSGCRSCSTELDRAGAPARPPTGPHLPASAAAAASRDQPRLRRAPATGHDPSSRAAHRTRTGSAAHALRHADHGRDRHRALHFHQHRQIPCQERLSQAVGDPPRRGGPPGPPASADLTS